jgi:hypothetical protein
MVHGAISYFGEIRWDEDPFCAHRDADGVAFSAAKIGNTGKVAGAVHAINRCTNDSQRLLTHINAYWPTNACGQAEFCGG